MRHDIFFHARFAVHVAKFEFFDCASDHCICHNLKTWRIVNRSSGVWCEICRNIARPIFYILSEVVRHYTKIGLVVDVVIVILSVFNFLQTFPMKKFQFELHWRRSHWIGNVLNGEKELSHVRLLLYYFKIIQFGW